jgi:hypothetical protein
MPQARSGGSRGSGSSRSGSGSGARGARSTGTGSSGSRSTSASAGRSSTAKRSTAKRSTAKRSTAKRPAAKRSTAKRATTTARSRSTRPKSGSPEARLEAAAQRVRKLNERIIEAGKDAGETTLTTYENWLKTVASTLERGPGSSDVEWISNIATAQAKFIRDVSASLTKVARKRLK